MCLLRIFKLVQQAPPYMRIPTVRDVVAIVGTLGPLGMMYACKNMCYMLIQVHWVC